MKMQMKHCLLGSGAAIEDSAEVVVPHLLHQLGATRNIPPTSSASSGLTSFSVGITFLVITRR